MDASHFQIDQPIGDNFEFYRFTSLTNFYQEASAAGQAKKVWNQSRILQQFKAEEIIRGQYGYQEVQTGYLVLLGHVERPIMHGMRIKIGMTSWNGKPYENRLAMHWM